MFRNFRRVFSHPAYWIVCIGIFFIVVLVIAYFTNLDLTLGLFSSSDANLKQKGEALFSFGSSISSDFSRISIAYIITVAFLVGLNVSFLIYYIRQRKRITQGILQPLSSVQLTGVTAITVMMLSIGFAALGAALAVPLSSVLSIHWLTTHMPFNGQEFGIIAIILLSVSIVILLNKIGDPLGSHNT